MSIHKAREVLDTLEKVYGCKVIHAAVMGSRRWGTQSPSSDYDIQFVFVFPKNRYLQLDPLPAESVVFKYDDTLEFHGYELKHYLKLIRKSNTFPSELLWSPSFLEPFRVMHDLRQTATQYFNRTPHWFNHTSLARREMYTIEETNYTNVKAMLYMAKSLLSAIYLEQNPKATELPLTLNDLLSKVADVPDGVYAHLKYLQKVRNTGRTDASINPVVFGQMKSMLAELKQPEPSEVKTSENPIPLDNIFQCLLGGAYDFDFKPPRPDYRPSSVPMLDLLKHQLGLRSDPTPRNERETTA